ncbi:MAG: aldose 1-epimerase family protein [Chitinophagaceae bacterium]
MFTIENDLLTVNVTSKGAELDSIYHKRNKLEYLWSADPTVWGKKSPILFPIVGTLKNNTYYYEENAYVLSRHGFAREHNFTLVEQSENSVSLSLKSDAETLKKFPFIFELIIAYTVVENSLTVTYKVINEDNKIMFFSVGGHPAFKVPLVPETRYEEYYLEFDKKESAGRWPISPDGLIESIPTPLMENTDRITLSRELFYQDALVFKHLSSHQVSLKSDKTTHGFIFDFTSFPYLGIWAAKNADFVCIEPWYGIADTVNSNQQLPEKEGIQKLEAGETFKAVWSVQLF